MGRDNNVLDCTSVHLCTVPWEGGWHTHACTHRYALTHSHTHRGYNIRARIQRLPHFDGTPYEMSLYDTYNPATESNSHFDAGLNHHFVSPKAVRCEHREADGLVRIHVTISQSHLAKLQAGILLWRAQNSVGQMV